MHCGQKFSAAATIYNDGVFLWLSIDCSEGLDCLYDFIAVQNLAKAHRLEIQMLCLGRSDEELGAVGIRSSIRHGDEALVRELHPQVLIFEGWPVNGFSTGSLFILKGLTALNAKARDHAVKPRSFVMKWLAGAFTCSLLAGAKALEIFDCPGHDVTIQTKDNASHLLLINLDVKKAFLSDLKLELCLLLFTLEQETFAHGLKSIVGVPVLLPGALLQPNHDATFTILAIIQSKVRVRDINLIQNLVIDHQPSLLWHQSSLQGPFPTIENHILLLHIVSDGNVNDDSLGAL